MSGRASSMVTVFVAVLMAGPWVGLGGSVAVAAAPLTVFHTPHGLTTLSPVPGRTPFLFQSNFEDHQLDGWVNVQGRAVVVATPSYMGAPSLSSSGKAVLPQIAEAHQNFSIGATSISIQADLYYAGGGSGFIGLFAPSGPVAVVGIVHGAAVWAGSSPGSATNVSRIPGNTAQPAGWVALTVLITNTSSTNGAWTMDVYIDRTDVAAATNLSVPRAGTYSGAEIRTTLGTVDYANIFVTSNQIPINVPGYNNMDGYGQGSGLVVSLLPAFTTLTAQMDLENWSVPQNNILSFQINAMNRVGTTQNTCVGFFQLGIDLNPNGKIAPWFVPNNNCVPYYYTTNNSLRASPGFFSPNSTRLTLTLSENPGSGMMMFRIVDHSISGANQTVQVSLPYSGSAFYGAYTQIEWQPCCSRLPISAYHFNGSLFQMQISGANVTAPMFLPASYMVPFALDVPPQWNYGVYLQGSAGYEQIA